MEAQNEETECDIQFRNNSEDIGLLKSTKRNNTTISNKYNKYITENITGSKYESIKLNKMSTISTPLSNQKHSTHCRLRLGLSRNARIRKPLHPNVSTKIS